MSLESLLSALSPSEKLEAMNILWRDLSSTPATYVSPEWHTKVLEERMNAPSESPSLPLDVAIEEVKARVNAHRTDI